jgi:predicted metalloprotease
MARLFPDLAVRRAAIATERAMTFNEGVQIDTSTTSTSGGGRVIAVGGGLGGLVIVLLALFLGVDPGGVTSQQPVNTREDAAPGFDLNRCRTGADANKYVQCRVVAARMCGCSVAG